MRVKTDENSHVRIKTMKKEQHSDWQTHVEKYYKGKPALEISQKKNKSIESAPLGTQSSRTEQKRGKDAMEVEQIKDRQSRNGPRSSASKKTYFFKCNYCLNF
jgi:hypothetical protein